MNRKDILRCLLSGLFLSLPFDSGKFWVFAWFGFVPVFFALNNKSLKQAFSLFFITGVIFWSLTIYWLVHVTFVGTTILILYLALYFGIFGLVVRPFVRRSTPYTLLFIPSAWVLLEYVRSHLLTGFPWALLGYSQYLNLSVIQIADIAGAFGVSFLVMQVNAGVVEIIWSARERRGSRLRITAALLFLFLLPSLYYGSLRLTEKKEALGSAVRVAVIQGNIPQELKWDPRARNPIISKYLSLSKDALVDHPDLVVWPEASFPELVGEEARSLAKVTQFAAVNKTPVLIGAVTCRDNAYYNSALFISESGIEIGRYNKVHLVPFGEYIPLKKLFPFLEVVVPIGDIDKGDTYTVFTLARAPDSPSSRTAAGPVVSSAAKFSVLICFEDVFPELSRRFVKEGADFLINITNDAWYKLTSAADQHLQASVFRAVENRRYLVRSANTGVSAFISPTGFIYSVVKDKSQRRLFVDGYKSARIALMNAGTSFYTRQGDLFVLWCALVCLLGVLNRGRHFLRKKNV